MMGKDVIGTCRLIISGKVQGVWYRASAKDKALSLGLKGRVWNEANGDVGAIVQGDENVVHEFIAWCKEGPPLAKVDGVKVERVEEKDVYEDFSIARAPDSMK